MIFSLFLEINWEVEEGSWGVEGDWE